MATLNLYNATICNAISLSAVISTTAITNMYVSGTGKAFKVSTLTLTNTTTSDVTVNVYAAPASTAPATTNKVLHNYLIAAGSSSTFPNVANMWLTENCTLAVQATIANSVNFSLTGIELN